MIMTFGEPIKTLNIDLFYNNFILTWLAYSVVVLICAIVIGVSAMKLQGKTIDFDGVTSEIMFYYPVLKFILPVVVACVICYIFPTRIYIENYGREISIEFFETAGLLITCGFSIDMALLFIFGLPFAVSSP